jgi:exonuclease SbcD
MRILHTADWHLGDRLGRIDRTRDLQRAVERIALLCIEHRAEVLLVAGDLFSELARPDTLRESIEHLGKVFLPFLVRGGTILALTGNHDNETFCQTLRHMMHLSAPMPSRPGALLPAGRFYLAAEPTLLRLADRQGRPVQFVLMPYPTPARYLDERNRRYAGLEEKNRVLQAGYAAKLRRLSESTEFDRSLPTVLGAHIHVQGALVPTLFRITERESIIFSPDDLPEQWSYVALGHIHHPQSLRNMEHIRYSGSIERLDLGEWKDDKGAILVDVGPNGQRVEPIWLPLPARPIYEVMIDRPREDVPLLRERYPDAAHALVRYHVTYEAGRDILNEVLAQVDEVFPNWYDRTWTEAGSIPVASNGAGTRSTGPGFRETVLGYLDGRLVESPDRPELLRLAEELLEAE